MTTKTSTMETGVVVFAKLSQVGFAKRTPYLSPQTDLFVQNVKTELELGEANFAMSGNSEMI